MREGEMKKAASFPGRKRRRLFVLNERLANAQAKTGLPNSASPVR
jgi:hypothetical protein